MMKSTMLALVLAKQPSVSKVEDLLQGLLTPQEIGEIEKRVKIVAMLKAGVPQHEIARRLGVGVATVARGSRELKNGRFSQIQADANAWRSSSG